MWLIHGYMLHRMCLLKHYTIYTHPLDTGCGCVVDVTSTHTQQSLVRSLRPLLEQLTEAPRVDLTGEVDTVHIKLSAHRNIIPVNVFSLVAIEAETYNGQVNGWI